MVANQTIHSRVVKAEDDILGAADRYRPKLSKALRDAVESMKGQLPDIEKMLAAGDIDAVVRAAAELNVPDEIMDDLVAATSGAAGQVARVESGRLNMSFNDVNVRAVRWAEQNAAETFYKINADVADNIRRTIVDVMEAGYGPRPTAALIGHQVGLTQPHSRAVNRLSASLLADGMDPRQVSRIVGAKADRLLRWRAETIARTETIRAANMGQQLSWDTAIDQNILPETVSKVWIATGDDRTCPICAVKDGDVVGVSETFQIVEEATSFTRVSRGGSGDAATFRVSGTKPLRNPHTEATPPAHPRCRCTVGIVETSAPPPDVGSIPPVLDSTQWDALNPTSRYTKANAAATRKALKATDRGTDLHNAMDEWQFSSTKMRTFRDRVSKVKRGKTLTNATKHRETEALIDGIRTSPQKHDGRLYRGMRMTSDDLDDLINAGPIDIDLTSYTSRWDAATYIAEEGTGSRVRGTERVILRMRGRDTQALPIQNIAESKGLFDEAEWVTGGRFRVTGIVQQESVERARWTVLDVVQEATL